MQNEASKIIIDTNLWITFLITKDFTKLDKIIFSRKCVLLFSQELLDEFLDVARRPKFKHFFSSANLQELLDTIDEYAQFIEVQTEIGVCRDPKDNFLLSLAVDGSADFLLTGDKDLLALGKIEGTAIITISDFLQNK